MLSAVIMPDSELNKVYCTSLFVFGYRIFFFFQFTEMSILGSSFVFSLPG